MEYVLGLGSDNKVDRSEFARRWKLSPSQNTPSQNTHSGAVIGAEYVLRHTKLEQDAHCLNPMERWVWFARVAGVVGTTRQEGSILAGALGFGFSSTTRGAGHNLERNLTLRLCTELSAITVDTTRPCSDGRQSVAFSNMQVEIPLATRVVLV